MTCDYFPLVFIVLVVRLICGEQVFPYEGAELLMHSFQGALTTHAEPECGE